MSSQKPRVIIPNTTPQPRPQPQQRGVGGPRPVDVRYTKEYKSAARRYFSLSFYFITSLILFSTFPLPFLMGVVDGMLTDRIDGHRQSLQCRYSCIPLMCFMIGVCYLFSKYPVLDLDLLMD